LTHFYCVSYYEGEVAWIPELSGGHYRIYAKAPLRDDTIDPAKVTHAPNVGYNIHSYLSFIADNYDSLPECIVFCKNNVFPRHVSERVFKSLAQRTVFTPIEAPERWERLGYPTSFRASDNGYLELNDSWYTRHYQCKYFSRFDSFYSYIFSDADPPRYIRFAPGANYVVPRANVLLRSRNFYSNLLPFVSHSSTSGESHMLERAIMAIWTSPLEESPRMSEALPALELDRLAMIAGREASKTVLKKLRYLNNKTNSLVHSLVDQFLPLR
jgi:hypothetical protein